MGSSQDLRRWQRLLLSVVVAVLVASGLVGYGLVLELRAANQAVSYARAERVIDAAGMEIALLGRAASVRGYLLAGDPVLLEERAAAKAELQRRLARLRDRNRPLTEIATLIGRLDATSNRAVALYPTDPEAARKTWELEARPVQEQLAGHVGQLNTMEREAFASARERAAEASRHSATLLAVLLGAVAIIITLLMIGYARVSRTLLARQEAEQAQATFRLLEQVPVGIFVLAADGKPYYANQHAQKLLGRGIVSTTPQQLAETYEAFEAGTDRPYPAERLPIVRALAGDVTEASDVEIRRDDEVIPLHVVGAPVHDARGELLYAVAGFQDVRELQRRAMRDSLTGLANRAAITQIYNRERAVSSRADRPLAIAIIDLDRFKSVNDTHGHASGDEVLKRTAAAIVASLRRSDAVGRWGGEEIVVMLPNTDAAGAERALDKSLADVRALEFVGKAGAKFSVTFSAGVVVSSPNESLDAAIARADTLLYEAKSAGRDRVMTGTA